MNKDKFEGINPKIVVLGERMKECLIVSRDIVKQLMRVDDLIDDTTDSEKAIAYDIIERMGVTLFIEANKKSVWNPLADTDYKYEPSDKPDEPETVEYFEHAGKKWPKMVRCTNCGKKLAHSLSKNPDKYDPVYYRCSTCKIYVKPQMVE